VKLFEVNHRSSVIPAFVSFNRLVDRNEAGDSGFLDNRRVVWQGVEVLRFKSTGIEVLPEAPEIFRSDAAQEFFLAERQVYRSQLRTMCQLRVQKRN